ncbi:MAG TPA: F0F1 ATP synthase subunit epsilon [Phycisphaerae bacterium]|nr:F0F1 ATP synthase subunit epsilon [Phycisphaerae bacterium]
MATGKLLRCQLITPDRAVLDTEAAAVVFPAHDGQMGVLHNRAPLLCKMGIGICRITTPDRPRSYYVDGGFARMLGNCLTILTEHACSGEEVDVAAAEQELADARSMRAADLAAQEDRLRAIARASAKIRLSKS